MNRLIKILLAAGMSLPIGAEDPARPIIDMHMHAIPVTAFGKDRKFCPGDIRKTFPGIDPSTEYTQQDLEDCPNPLLPPESDDALLDRTLRIMEQYNITGVLIGDVETVSRWRQSAPGKFIPSLPFVNPDKLDLDEVRGHVSRGDIALIGEVWTHNIGLSPSDSRVDHIWALAEELDIPVGIHTGPGVPGDIYFRKPAFKSSLVDPLELEEMLTRHPKLRVYVMHAGYPYLDNMIMLLYGHPQVYVDVGVLTWYHPRKEFHRYLRTLVEAGFGKRIMFGTDFVVWPDAIPIAIEAIESADFLTDSQKRDIFHDNAARFLRLSEK
jgi:predicted TIM-barrel fold metal-dependent hydrolase